MGKRYYCLKLPDDFFRQKPIKKLRKIAGGDTYTIIYLKMLLIAMKHDGRLYFEGVEDNFYEELALELDEEAENVNVTVRFLLAQGLIELVDETEYRLTECDKMVGSEAASTQRSRQCRERKALQCNTNATPCNTLEQNWSVEKEKEIEIDSESDSKAIAAAVEKMITDFSGGDAATADALREYAAMREKKNGKQLSPTVLRLALDDLARLTPDRDAQTAIVRKSVEKRWTSFYAPEVGPESTNAANNEKSYDRKKNPAERAQRREMGGGPDKSSLEYRAVMRMMGTPPDGGGNPDGNE